MKSDDWHIIGGGLMLQFLGTAVKLKQNGQK